MERRFTLIELIFTDFKVLNNYRFILSYLEENFRVKDEMPIKKKGKML